MTRGYSDEKAYSNAVASKVKARATEIADALKVAFGDSISPRQAHILELRGIRPEILGELMLKDGRIMKPLLVVAGVAMRAIERDLDIRNLNTYNPVLSRDEAVRLAEYLLELLPDQILVETLVEADRVDFLSSQKRALKGAWEKKVTRSISEATGHAFKKRKLTIQDEIFEIDAAYPQIGGVEYAVDIKRCEARRDFQKRSDEIVNKARVLKTQYPNAKFASVVYYPFDEEDFRGRLSSGPIELVAFGNDSDESILEVGRKVAREFKLKPS